MKNNFIFVLIFSLTGFMGGCGDINVGFWEKQGTVQIDSALYPGCTFSAIREIDPNNFDEYKTFGKDIHGPWNAVPGVNAPIYFSLSDKGIVEILVATREWPSKPEEEEAEKFINKSIQAIKQYCNKPKM